MGRATPNGPGVEAALGCRVVGIAGGPEKCKWVEDELGFDACVDYREAGLSRKLAAACPNGVDIYFDNVGGKVLESALNVMNEKGRVICCGAISQYDTDNVMGPRNLPGVAGLDFVQPSHQLERQRYM